MLDTVNLNHIVTREGGWDTAADWKVRMMMLDMIMIMMIMVAIPVLIAQKQAPSYASPKLSLTHLRTGVRSRATSVAKKLSCILAFPTNRSIDGGGWPFPAH